MKIEDDGRVYIMFSVRRLIRSLLVLDGLRPMFVFLVYGSELAVDFDMLPDGTSNVTIEGGARYQSL